MNQYYPKSNISHASFPTDIRNILRHLPCSQNKQLSKAIKTRLEKDNLIKNWVNIVGPKLAEHTKPLDIQDQKIIVAVDETKWMSVVQQNEKQLKKKIKKFMKLRGKQSIIGNQEKVRALHKEEENSYALKLILEKMPSSDYPSPHASIIEPDLDKETVIKIEGILNHIKNNEKLKQVFSNILTKYYRYNQNCKANKGS